MKNCTLCGKMEKRPIETVFGQICASCYRETFSPDTNNLRKQCQKLKIKIHKIKQKKIKGFHPTALIAI